MKKGPLSKKEKTYIKENYLDTTSVVMAEEMGRSLRMIDKFLATMKTETSEKTEEVKMEKKSEPVKPPSKASDLLARNKERGVVVMTEASSMESDGRPKKRKQPERYKGMIHTIKES